MSLRRRRPHRMSGWKHSRPGRVGRRSASCFGPIGIFRGVYAVTAARIDRDNPLTGLEVGERPDPSVPDGWTTVRLKAAALNHHDLWSLRGVGLGEDQLPMILGCDGAGVTADGDDVVVHAVIGDPAVAGGDETMDPKRSLLSEKY